MNTDFQILHDDSSTETMESIYTTGMIDISKYDRPRNIRRINLNYESKANIVVRVYADGFIDTNQICSMTFPHNVTGGGPRLVSLRPTGGARAKTIVVKIHTPNVFGSATIRKMEIEIDE